MIGLLRRSSTKPFPIDRKAHLLENHLPIHERPICTSYLKSGYPWIISSP